MIQYALKCDNEHSFDSWFQSAAAFEKLSKCGMVTCAVCGSEQIKKAIMAPRVKKSEKSKTSVPSLSAPATPTEQAIKELKTYVETNSDYVGNDFATQARDMHEGIAPERSIYGEAKPEDAKKLIEEGIPVTPLPFSVARKTN
jgi:hypothetical protein